MRAANGRRSCLELRAGKITQGAEPEANEKTGTDWLWELFGAGYLLDTQNSSAGDIDRQGRSLHRYVASGRPYDSLTDPVFSVRVTPSSRITRDA